MGVELMVSWWVHLLKPCEGCNMPMLPDGPDCPTKQDYCSKCRANGTGRDELGASLVNKPTRE